MAFPNSSDEVPRHFFHCRTKEEGVGLGGLPVVISSTDSGATAVSFLQAQNPMTRIKMVEVERRCNFFIVLVFVGELLQEDLTSLEIRISKFPFLIHNQQYPFMAIYSTFMF